VAQLTKQIVNVKKEYKNFDEEEIFPQDRAFETHSGDVFEEQLMKKPAHWILYYFKKAGVFQTGKIQHYLLYALVFLIIIFLLTLLNWI